MNPVTVPNPSANSLIEKELTALFGARRPTLWITRERPKIDRIACPWLIRRFVDPAARILFVPPADVPGVAEATGAAAFDVDGPGVQWSHAGDACTFDPVTLLGEPAFDRIILSYSLSMIPDWQGALDHAAGCLAPGGQLHVVDFGDLQDLPSAAQSLLRRWLAMFHVEQRAALPEVAARIAAARGLMLESRRGPLGYYAIHVLAAPAVP